MSGKILVVDDERDITRVISFSLQKFGYEVITATNGQEGVDKAIAEKPDLILLDISMPVMNGHQALEHIRKNKDLKDTPVMMLTAKSDPGDISNASIQGVLEYITKPFDLMELREKINNVLSGSKCH